MGKHLIINFDLLNNNNIEIEEFLFLYKLYINKNYRDNNINLNNLNKNNFIKVINNNIILLKKRGKEFIEEHLIDVKEEKKIATYDEIDHFVQEFRNKWKDLKAGSMGSAVSCRDKLTTWIKNNPQYSFNDILKAADLYIKSVNNLNYLQRADYFVEKIEKGVKTSRLSAYIEDIDNFAEDGWSNELN